MLNLAPATFPLQSYLFAQLIELSTWTGTKLTNARNHWSLMIFILAIGVAIAYFTLAFSANIISTVSV